MKIVNTLKLVFLIGLLALSMGLYGCAGSDGSDGSDGADGEPAVTTDETCNVCHSTDRIADIDDRHTIVALEKPEVVDIVVSRSAADTLTVFFSVIDASGSSLEGIMDAPGDAGNTRVYMADIVPAGTVTGNAPQTTWDTDYLERWARESGDDAGVIATDLGNGDYSFQMAATPAYIGSASGDAPDGDLNHTQRVYVRADARDIVGFNRTMGVADFTMPTAGADTGIITATTRTIVDALACISCHNDPLERAAHGGGYQSPQVCNMCHSPIGVYGDEMQADLVWMASLVHKIHAAIDIPAFPTRIHGNGYVDVTFPQPIADCEVCHFDNGQDMADAWNTNPTMEVCGTCHTAVDFGTGTGHVGGAQANNNNCSGCHGSASIIGYHADALVPAAADTPEFDVTITMTAPADTSNSYYVAGDAPIVTVTLAAIDDTSITTNYDAAGDAEGDRDGNLSEAGLRVYGPRAHFMPVLTAAAAEGSQSNNLLNDADDAQVLTDATGFKYQLSAIPPTMAAGTYMVRFEGGDYGAIADTNYQTMSTAVISFQIGTTTVEAKVAGDCITCHGDTRMHLSGAHPHNAAFDTDECSACHDYSGNYGTALVQRVHAVHSESELGADGHNRAWEEITFPQNQGSCQACHTSGVETYGDFSGDRTQACTGCHGDNAGMKDHALQNGGGSF